MRRIASRESAHAERVECSTIPLAEVRRLPPIVSGFETDRVFRLEKRDVGTEAVWRLAEVQVDFPYRKRYDSGDPEEWLASHMDAGPVEDLSFLAANVHGKVEGLLTWRPSTWNNTLWLLDIRVRSSARRSGVGSALLRRLKLEAAQEQARGIAVETQINNYPAISFYRKHGFELAGFNDHLYTNDDLSDQDVAVFLFWER